MLLQRRQFADAARAEAHQRLLLLQREGPSLAGSLQLDQAAVLRHHAVEIDHRGGVLLIAEVEHRLVFHDSNTYCRNTSCNGNFFNYSIFFKFLHGQNHSNK